VITSDQFNAVSRPNPWQHWKTAGAHN